MNRLHKICNDHGITLEQLAELAQVEVPIFEAYATGELPFDELTLGRIYEFDESIDWMWLENGYDPEDLEAIGNAENHNTRNEC